MAEVTAKTYTDALNEMLLERKEWLEKSELPKLKEDLRVFQISFSTLYNIFLRKKLINEDPYKQEAKINDISVPETGSLTEIKRIEQMSLRLANYDNQLDFLVNFYQFGVDFLNLERIRNIVGLVRYIDWMNLTPDSRSPNTVIVSTLVSNAKVGGDSIGLSIIGESLTKLPKCTTKVMRILRDLSAYHKEFYKFNIRGITKGMPASEINPGNIKKKMSVMMPGTPFYQEFIEELIREDYSKDGPALQEVILKSLKLAEEKKKIDKPKVSYKNILLSGIQAIGAAGSGMVEIAKKMDENEVILENQKKGLWEKIKKILKSMTSANPDELVYELQYFDQVKGVETWEHLNFRLFRAEFDKKTKIYMGMSGQGSLMTKLADMPEEQILSYLERAIKDLQALHRTLAALDEFFKSSVTREERDQIKGIKPELASIKNCYIKANKIRHEYSALKEEEEQLKRLGLTPAS
ncbi:MAG: hypothetical protein FWD36_04695 [Treponema sp.]|nr:hypothetical protein [Treponema sp.]